jgi:hypothetical protein
MASISVWHSSARILHRFEFGFGRQTFSPASNTKQAQSRQACA